LVVLLRLVVDNYDDADADAHDAARRAAAADGVVRPLFSSSSIVAVDVAFDE
jgi:hypothetical protein